MRRLTGQPFLHSSWSMPPGGLGDGHRMPPARAPGGRGDHPRDPEEEQRVAHAHHQAHRRSEGDHVRQGHQHIIGPLQVVFRAA